MHFFTFSISTYKLEEHLNIFHFMLSVIFALLGLLANVLILSCVVFPCSPVLFPMVILAAVMIGVHSCVKDNLEYINSQIQLIIVMSLLFNCIKLTQALGVY